MICPKCGRQAFSISPDTWVVCVATGRADGETIHESWSFGRGSPLSDSEAETHARTWAASDRRFRYPAGAVLAVWRQEGATIPQEQARG